MKMPGRFGLVLCCAFALAAFRQPAMAAATLDVPASFPTIQSAIDAAVDGDTVLVANGTYHERIDFKGKAITVRGSDAHAILDADHAGPAVTFQSHETEASIFRGFAVRNGTGAAGAGVLLRDSSAAIINVTFEGNQESNGGYGAAIGGMNASPVITGAFFTGNTCDNHSTSGVISFVGASSPRIVNNIIVDNACRGIDLVLANKAAPFVSNNTIIGNRDAILDDTRLSATRHLIQNNILYANKAGLVITTSTAGNEPTFAGNLVFANKTDYSGIADQTNVRGNRNADPLLGGLDAGDYHPDAGSPVIDHGSSDRLGDVLIDYYGATRTFDGNNDGTAAPDIGAVEFHVAPPQVTLDLDPPRIPIGGTATLTWSAAGAASCFATGNWSGGRSTSGTETVGSNAAGSFDYNLFCTGDGGGRLKTATLEAGSAATVSLDVTPKFVLLGDPVQLQWFTTNADLCRAGAGWHGKRAVSGQASATPAELGVQRYTLTCTGNGTAVATARVQVLARPTVTFTATPSPVNVGEPITLTWSSENTTHCHASGAWHGGLDTGGTFTVTPKRRGPLTFDLDCSSKAGVASAHADVTVKAAPTVTVKARAINITLGQSTQLYWRTTNATSCEASTAWSGPRATSGEETVTPPTLGKNIYRLTCTGPDGTTISRARVNVRAAQ